MKSSLIWVRDAFLDVVAPRKWLLCKTLPNGTPSICSSHRTRADAVLAIPVRADGFVYSVIQQAEFLRWSALAAFWADRTTPTSTKENDQ